MVGERIGLTEEDKKELIDMYNSKKYYMYEIAEWFGVCIPTVIRVIKERKKNDKNNKEWCKTN